MDEQTRYGRGGLGVGRAVIAALFAGLMAANSPVTAQDSDFPGIEALMSAEEFRESGLHELNEEQLRSLDAWLLRFTAGDAEMLQQSSAAVREVEKDFAVEARLADGFSGWTGKTMFTLDNGQVWQQRLEGRYPYRGPANPEVRISKNWLGFYKMTLVEAGRSIGVSRRR
ncbi:MAG: hypothetical protein AB8B57_09530 [Congregibacter sp.]